FFSSRRRHTRFSRDWSSDVCSSDLATTVVDDLKNLFGEVEGMSKALTEKLEALKETIERGEKITEKALEELQQWENEEEAKFDRSEERRVGKEYRERRSAQHNKRK